MFNIFKRAKPKSDVDALVKRARDIVADFGLLIESETDAMSFKDVKLLPHSKESILQSICLMLRLGTDKQMANALEIAALSLTFYQPGIGPNSIHPLGLDPNMIAAAELSAEQLVHVIGANEAGAERFESLEKLREAEWESVLSLLAGIPRPN